MANTNTMPVLADLAASVTFAENTVNATPQFDGDVTFTDTQNTI